MQSTGGMFELIRTPIMLHDERTNCSQIQENSLPAHLNFTMKGGATEKFNKFEFCGADRQKSEFIHLGEIISGNKKVTEAAAALYCCDENHLL
jgi:hypothetical protein